MWWLSFQMNLHTVLASGCTHLHSHQQYSLPTLSSIYCLYILWWYTPKHVLFLFFKKGERWVWSSFVMTITGSQILWHLLTPTPSPSWEVSLSPHLHWVPKLAQSLALSKCSINTCKMREFNMLLFPRSFIKWRCTKAKIAVKFPNTSN